MAKSSDLERVTLYWHAVPNEHTARGGWMPVYDHNGKQRGSTYGKGYDLETALEMAKAAAEDEATHYVGDWDVVVARKPGSRGTPTSKTAKRSRKTASTAHARKYGPKASDKIGQTMREFKRGKLKSSSGKKVTSRKQALAIGISQARRAGYKVPSEPPAHASMRKPGSSIDDKVRTQLSHMRPGDEIDARGMARTIGADALGTDYALQRAARDGHAVTDDGKWYGPATSTKRHGARKKSSAQLNQEIAEALAKPRRKANVSSAHAQMKTKTTKKIKQPLRVAYRLQLTPSEMRAVEFAQGRYSWPDMLAAHATEGGLIAFTEPEMWQWTDDVDSDTEGGHSPFPLASDSLASKLQDFYDERV